MVSRRGKEGMGQKKKSITELRALENPFEKLTVEEFNDDYSLIAYLFAKPQENIYSKLIGRQNYIFVGGWGSGKTMLLKYLGFETQFEVAGADNIRESDFVGIYVKVGRGSFKPFLKPGGEFKPGGEALFGHYFNLFILERIISVITYSVEKGVFDLSNEESDSLCERIGSRFSVAKRSTGMGFKVSSPKFSNLQELKAEVERLRYEIETFLDTRDLEEDLSYEAQVFTPVRSFLNEVVQDIWSHWETFGRKRFYILLDECEQFSKGQQRVINTIIKQRPTTLVFKLASRPPDIQTMETVDEGIGLTDRECKHLYLDKAYDPASASFKRLCKEVAEKRLKRYNYPVTDITKVLGKFTVEDECGRDLLIAHLKDKYPSRERVNDSKRFPTVYKDFKVAAAFQILSRKGGKKYAGFNTFAMLSSGIMSHFLELCRDTFTFSFGTDIIMERARKISFKRVPLQVEIQNKAAAAVSEDFYNSIKGRAQSLKDTAIDMEFGGRIQYIVTVLGGIFREKLMGFNEPEAARVEIPEGVSALDSSRENPVQQMFNTAIGISVLQESTPYLPQHIGGVKPPTYVLNRILAPYLRISPRPRWRTIIRAAVFSQIMQVSENEFKTKVFERKKRGKEERKKEEQKKEERVPRAQLSLFPSSLASLSEKMPVLSYITNKIEGEPFRDKGLLILLHFLRDLVPFMQSCRKLGASPESTKIFYKNYNYANKAEVEEYLKHEGYRIYPIEDVDATLVPLNEAKGQSTIVIEDGGIIVPRLHNTDFRAICARTLGAVEQTSRGIRNDQKVRKILFPIVSIPGSQIKDTFEPPHVARAVVNNLQKLLPTRNFSGKSALVIGFGGIGEQIALHLRDTLKMVVSVFDLDEAKLVKAQQYGFNTEEALRQGVRTKFLIVGATGETVIGRDEILAIDHNTYLVSASSEQWEFGIHDLNALSSKKEELYEDGKKVGTRYIIRNKENYINLIADGYPVNFWYSESMPNEVSDLVMSLILLSAIEVALAKDMPAGIDSKITDQLTKRWKLAKIYLQYHS